MDETFLQTHPDIVGMSAADIAFVLDAIRIARLFRSLPRDERHQHRHERGKYSGQTKEPAPLVLGYDKSSNRETSEDDRGEHTDRHLPHLNHQTENAGKGSALAAIEPGGVDLDHAGRAEGLEISVHQPDQGEGAESAGEGSETENQVHRDRADGADEHGRAPPDAIAKQTVDQLPRAVGDRPRAQNSRDTGVIEAELLLHPGRGPAEVVAQHVEGGVHGAEDDPVQTAAGAEAGRIFLRDFAHRSGGGENEGRSGFCLGENYGG